jgi:uncharacterized membrane protein YfcA
MYVSEEQLNFVKRKLMRHGTSGLSGIMGLLGGIIGVGLLMTLLNGDMLHWIPIALVVLVSLRAMHRVNK